MSRDDDTGDIDRSFEGQVVLQRLLTKSGALADVEDVVGAFREAVKKDVPAPVVIQALWDEEPRFSSSKEAARLFGNLLGLYELVAAGKKLDLAAAKGVTVKREKAPRPEPFGAREPDDAFIEAAWRWFDDFPKERKRFEHAFENRQDPLVSWLDASGLDDAAFALARHLVGEVFAMLELGGRAVETVHEEDLPDEGNLEALPRALAEWIDETLFEAATDEAAPLGEAAAARVREVVARAALALWRAA